VDNYKNKYDRDIDENKTVVRKTHQIHSISCDVASGSLCIIKVTTCHTQTHAWSHFKALQCKVHYIKNEAVCVDH
jgi:hypothetical protein